MIKVCVKFTGRSLVFSHWMQCSSLFKSRFTFQLVILSFKKLKFFKVIFYTQNVISFENLCDIIKVFLGTDESYEWW